MCMLVNRAPHSNIAASSLHELDVVYEVFQKSASTSKPAAVLLVSISPNILRRPFTLRPGLSNQGLEKGHDAVDRPHYDDQSSLSRAELDRLGGGKTHLISQSSPRLPPPTSSSPSVHSSPSDAQSSCPSQPGSQCTWDGQGNGFDIHPRIMQDMRVFDRFEQPSFTASGSLDSSESFFQAMSDVQFSGSSVWGGDLLNTFHPAQPYGAPNGIQEAPVLDAAWQSFVGQLGF